MNSTVRLALKHFLNLLQGVALGLWEKEPDDDNEHGQDAAEDDVVLPSDLTHGDGVDLVSNHQTDKSADVHGGHTTATKGIWENLDDVRLEQRGPGDGVEEEGDEDEANDGFASLLTSRRIKVGAKSGPDGVRDEHAACRGEEQGSASEAIDQHGADKYGGQPVGDLKQTVDESLVLGIGDADCVENEDKIVAADG